MQACYRHPSRETGVSCSSCGRPICTDCMTPTPVGMRCPECARQRTQVRTVKSLAGGEPRVTYAVIAVNLAVFLAQTFTAGGGLRARGGELYERGVLFGPYVNDGEWWRLVTSGFMHADPLHLLFNMLGVYFLGQMLEPTLGSVRYAALYGASLIAGSFGALLLSPGAGTVGASGAVFGLLGAAFVLMRHRGIDPMRSFIGPILILNLLLSFRPGVSLGGHLGGLAGGLLCAALITYVSQRRRGESLGIAGCVAVAIVAAIGAITAAGTPSLY